MLYRRYGTALDNAALVVFPLYVAPKCSVVMYVGVSVYVWVWVCTDSV